MNGHDASHMILRLRQGSQSVSDYAIDFQTLATDSGWEGCALVDSFLNGLSETIKDELLTRELLEDLDQIIALAIRIDSRLERNSCQRSLTRYFRSRCQPSPASSTHPPSVPSTKKGEHGSETEAMMVDQTKLFKEQRERRIRERACLYCEGAGHFALNCPSKRPHPLVERGALVAVIPIESSNQSRTCLPVIINWTGGTKKTSTLLDSGAEESFMDAGTATRCGIPLVEVSHPLVANSLNGQRLGRITKATIPLCLLVSGNHQETIPLLIIDTPHLPVVLGHPWMVKHNPELDWKRHDILGWSPICSTSCLMKAHSMTSTPRGDS